jgi:hypothetical protein
MRFICGVLGATIALAGCTFRLETPQHGKFLSLSVDDATIGGIREVHAKVRFLGDTQPPVMAIAPGAIPTDVQVVAIAERSPHFMDLGIFKVDHDTPHDYDLKVPLALTRPGTYRILSLLLDDDGNLTDQPAASVEVRVE